MMNENGSSDCEEEEKSDVYVVNESRESSNRLTLLAPKSDTSCAQKSKFTI